MLNILLFYLNFFLFSYGNEFVRRDICDFDFLLLNKKNYYLELIAYLYFNFILVIVIALMVYLKN